MPDPQAIQTKLEKKLKPGRYQHTLGVMYTAAALAMCYGTDLQEAILSGLLHDCGKYGSVQEQMNFCKEHKIKLTQAELNIPALIHAKIGAYLAEYEYKIKNPRILNAILYHTTGKPDMNLLEKIVYLADFMEPGRKMIPALPEVRSLAFHEIDRAVCLCAESTLKYLDYTGAQVDPLTRMTYEFYKNQGCLPT